MPRRQFGGRDGLRVSRIGSAAVLLCFCSAVAAAPREPVHGPPFVMPALPPAMIDDALEIGGDTIEGRKVRTRMTVEVAVNGQGPFRFIVDSGADTTVIGTRIARTLQLPLGTPAMLNGVTASSRVDRVLVETLRVGNTDVPDLQLPVLDERDLGGQGMIGIDALVQQRLMLDFEARTIRVEDARRPPPRLDGEIVVIARRRRGQLILTQARASGTPVDAVIDTGTEITIGNHALRDQLIRRRGVEFTTIDVTGVTGVTATLKMTTIPELRLGPVVLQDVPIAFADIPPFTVFGLTEKPALLLGTDLMETFRRVSLDFRARKVRFQLRRCEARGVSLSTSPSGQASRIGAAKDAPEACRR